MRPHDEFLELCALSTSGELSNEEQRRLEEHLAVCPQCREAKREFEAVVDVGVPLLASQFVEPCSEPEPAYNNDGVLFGSPAAPGSLPLESVAVQANSASPASSEGRSGRWRRNGHRPTRLNWSLLWLPFAAGILLTVALGIYAYRLGTDRGLQTARVVATSADGKMTALEERISDAGHQRELLQAQLQQRDRAISNLQRQIQLQSAALDAMKTTEAKLEQSLETSQTAKQQAAEDNASLAQKMNAAQASVEKMQLELDAVRQQRSQDQVQVAGLESQIGDLTGELREREQTIDRQDALLGHDRDIRELMGARDLYIAEVYDVDRDGKTEKPFGRVFYTKGKSLVFYAYDLDQRNGPKNASTFQAWGQRGYDSQQALNLGIFYQDNAAKKRWVVKFDNAKQLTEIDAVFVTVEPKGGSPKPSSKPLLFAYLKISPNHP